MGGKFHDLRQLTIEIWDWAMENGTQVFAEYIPGKDNVVADHLSRRKRDSMDWKLNPVIFSQLNRIWGHIK